MEPKSKHFVGEVGQKAMVVHDGKLLLVRGGQSPLYDIPGGRIHIDETPEAGLKRELKEELGIDIVVGRPRNVFVESKPKPEWPRYFVLFEARLVDPTQQLVLDPTEIYDARWVTKEEIPTLDFWPGWKEIFIDYFDQAGHE